MKTQEIEKVLEEVKEENTKLKEVIVEKLTSNFLRDIRLPFHFVDRGVIKQRMHDAISSRTKGLDLSFSLPYPELSYRVSLLLHKLHIDYYSNNPIVLEEPYLVYNLPRCSLVWSNIHLVTTGNKDYLPIYLTDTSCDKVSCEEFEKKALETLSNYYKNDYKASIMNLIELYVGDEINNYLCNELGVALDRYVESLKAEGHSEEYICKQVEHYVDPLITRNVDSVLAKIMPLVIDDSADKYPHVPDSIFVPYLLCTGILDVMYSGGDVPLLECIRLLLARANAHGGLQMNIIEFTNHLLDYSADIIESHNNEI